jgi:hypothetical protein
MKKSSEKEMLAVLDKATKAICSHKYYQHDQYDVKCKKCPLWIANSNHVEMATKYKTRRMITKHGVDKSVIDDAGSSKYWKEIIKFDKKRNELIKEHFGSKKNYIKISRFANRFGNGFMDPDYHLGKQPWCSHDFSKMNDCKFKENNKTITIKCCKKCGTHQYA